METKEKYALISLVCGILSAIFYWMLPFLPVIAVVCGSIALKKIKINGLKGKVMAICGIILGLLYCFQIIIKVHLNGGQFIL